MRKRLFKSIRKTAKRINLPEDEAMKLAEEAKRWTFKNRKRKGKHLLPLKKFGKTRIISPKEFKKILER